MAQLSNNSAGAELTQRDANHAAKTFTSEPGYTNAPYSGFLFHVNVVFNNVAPSSIDKKTVSMLIKASDLPEVQFETETYNQYNRKRIVNKRVIYQPIKLTFHDDVANNVRNMWIAYNQHYNADSAHITNAAWKYDNVYRSEGFGRAYGLDVNTVTPFLDKIEIHSMGNHRYSKMTLVNPIINSAAFDDHNYSEGAKIMETTFNVEYENIIYSTGGTDQISNFGKNNPEHYDLNASPLGVDRTSFLEALLDTPINIADLLGSFIKDQFGMDTQAGRVRGNNNNGSAYDLIKSATSRSPNNNNNGLFNFPSFEDGTATNSVVANQGGVISGSAGTTSNGGNVSVNVNQATTADIPGPLTPYVLGAGVNPSSANVVDFLTNMTVNGSDLFNIADTPFINQDSPLAGLSVDVTLKPNPAGWTDPRLTYFFANFSNTRTPTAANYLRNNFTPSELGDTFRIPGHTTFVDLALGHITKPYLMDVWRQTKDNFIFKNGTSLRISVVDGYGQNIGYFANSIYDE